MAETLLDQLRNPHQSQPFDTTARAIGEVVIKSSQLTDDFSNVERIPRLQDGRRENDVEHSYMLALTATALAREFYPNLDADLITRFALVHDMLELEVGDVSTFDLNTAELEEKNRREQEAKYLVLSRLSQISSSAAEDMEDYEKQEVPEAVFVRVVDKLLPVAVDITGDGIGVIREDYGIDSLETLKVSHDQLFARIKAKFGEDFPELIAAHAWLVTQFEKKYSENPDQGLKAKEIKRGPVETELKFVIDKLPPNIDLGSFPHIELRQAYIVVTSDGSEQRIRSFDNERFEQTVKSGGTVQRKEKTIDIEKDMFEVLWSITNKKVEKTRYKIPHGKYTIELDVYYGHLTGLITAEVEFPGRPEEAAVKASAFVPPQWFGKDVSNDIRFKNQYLAAHGIPPKNLSLGEVNL